MPEPIPKSFEDLGNRATARREARGSWGSIPQQEYFIVHSLDDARKALAAGNAQPVTLQSAPDAILYAGSLYLLTLYTQACAEFPDVKSTFILDCGEHGAQALEAMHIGHKHIRIRAASEMEKKIRSVAEQLGVDIISS
jgi:hypothetical protein